MDPFVTQTTKPRGVCKVKGCSRKISSRKNHKRGGFCRRCAEHRYKARHPYAYALNKLRNNARRRGIPFELTLEEFIMFCDLTDYMSASGRFADCLSIDRIDPKRGYTLDNIQAVTVSVNSRHAHIQTKVEKLKQWRDLIAAKILKLQAEMMAA